MQKSITSYTVQLLSSVKTGIIAQVLFKNNQSFVGRIDFYAGVDLPKSYLWHPNNAADESQTYLVLAMPFDAFGSITELIRNERPWGLELWPSSTPMKGATTDGYGGKLYTTADEAIGEQEFDLQALRP
ncbi:MAG: hypothetical protein HGB22_08305 [Chlorobiaceae bacterium]|nr:hypothetical protein [Chlorobiaceae bacterium]